VYAVLCFLVFGCQYQCSQPTGKTRLHNDPLCIEWDSKPTHSLTLDSTAVLQKSGCVRIFPVELHSVEINVVFVTLHYDI